MDAVARNCPVNYATPFTEELSRTACTVDVSVLLTSFTRRAVARVALGGKGVPRFACARMGRAPSMAWLPKGLFRRITSWMVWDGEFISSWDEI